MTICRVVVSLFSVLIAGLCHAGSFSGSSFSHHDWELACDNTGTCRAAGYQADGQELTVSVLFTRKAGPAAPIAGQVMIGYYGEMPAFDALPAVFELVLRIDKRTIGKLNVSRDNPVADLAPQQVEKLLAALVRKSTIDFTAAKLQWQLSDQGAAAVLLKMDEFQGRIGTPSALVKKGTKSESTVRPASPAPEVAATPFHPPLPGDELFAKGNYAALRDALRATLKGEKKDDCPLFFDSDPGHTVLKVLRVTKTQVLVFTPCWQAAYNFGSGYWLVSSSPPFEAVLITASGSDLSGSAIHQSHKGRGLGDCWALDHWTWDGKAFVHTASSTTGMCKLVAAGGAWQLPTIVTKVRDSAALGKK
jgi:hypothetical protein